MRGAPPVAILRRLRFKPIDDQATFAVFFTQAKLSLDGQLIMGVF
jgi:hypothetical protein